MATNITKGATKQCQNNYSINLTLLWSGYKTKYPNPLVKLVIDAYEQKILIACVYNEQPESNVMECVYTNFSVNAAVAEEV